LFSAANRLQIYQPDFTAGGLHPAHNHLLIIQIVCQGVIPFGTFVKKFLPRLGITLQRGVCLICLFKNPITPVLLDRCSDNVL
jgi:hypothetical protein